MHICHSLLCFGTTIGFASHVGYSTRLIMPAFSLSWTVSLVTSCRCLENVLFFWVTSGTSGGMPRWCSAISWEMVPKSCGAHEKISLYSKRISHTSWRIGGGSVYRSWSVVLDVCCWYWTVKFPLWLEVFCRFLAQILLYSQTFGFFF